MENTYYPHYVSEKNLNSIAGGCLPIYYGKYNQIYYDFEKNSFIDYADYYSPKKLLDSAQNMSDGEYLHRLNSCIRTYHKIYNRLNNGSYGLKPIVDKICAQIQSLAD